MNYEIVAKAMAIILFAICSAWAGYVTSKVLSLTTTIEDMQDTRERLSKFRDWNIKQGGEIKRLDKRIDNLCKPPADTHTH